MNRFELSNPLALVTGADSANGRATVLSLAQRGARVVAVGSDRDELADTAAHARSAGGVCDSLVLDRSDPSALERLVQDVEQRHSTVGTLVQFVAPSRPIPFSGLDEAACSGTELSGVITAARLVARRLARSRSTGTIVTVLPSDGHLPLPGNAPAAMTNGALAMFSETLHLELRTSGSRALLRYADSTDPEEIAESLVADILSGTRSPVLPRTLTAATRDDLRLLPGRNRKAARRPRLVVITGAGSGIGRATAERYGRTGARIIVSDIDLDAAEVTAAAIRAVGGRAEARRLDVTDVAAFEQFAESVRADHGVCDLMVNNAGIGIVGEIVDTSQTDWDRIVGINLLGMVHGSRIFGRQMLEAGVHGHIVNVASAAAFLPMAELASYSTTKAGVKAFSDSIRAELAQHGIGVSTICPGPIATNIFASATHTGTAADEAAVRSSLTAALFDRARALHIFPGPDTVARAIDSAVRLDRGTALVRPEAYLVYALRRSAPALLRNGSAAICNSKSVDLLYRVGRSPGISALLHA